MEEHHSEHHGTTHTHHSGKKNNPLTQLEALLNEYLGRKAPQMPARWREWLANALPWVTLIIFMLTLPALLVIFGLSTVIVPAAVVFGGAGSGLGHLLGVLFLAGSIILELVALPGLFKRKHSSWRLVYYASLLSILNDIVFFSLSGLVGGVIGLWILFQIKSYYNK